MRIVVYKSLNLTVLHILCLVLPASAQLKNPTLNSSALRDCAIRSNVLKVQATPALHCGLLL